MSVFLGFFTILVLKYFEILQYIALKIQFYEQKNNSVN